MLFKFKHRSANIRFDLVHVVAYIRNLVLWVKQLNLFKSANNRSADNIKQQRITTRLYLILFSGTNDTNFPYFENRLWASSDSVLNLVLIINQKLYHR
ncbi:unnamed protein product [Adineta steineri]|uniref:Uncharacterized protein n=1 Tax=Adineta steineri TaxID=433720 RepID=A0A815Q8B5_9BILA|nr:unnamed protein product [Adineta steineri]CAF1460317.1 unnamed protein product [Adineta steineri]